MYNLGHTRSSQKRNHLLLTPDTFIRTSMPGMKNCSAVIHVNPSLGAQFAQYTAEFAAGGELGTASAQRFVYVLQGELTLEVGGKRSALGPQSYAYLPEETPHTISAKQEARAEVIEKRYTPAEGFPAPSVVISREEDIASQALNGDADLQVKSLLPDSMSFDFAVNTMSYRPGAALSMVEMHVMEHGLLMLEGGGIYRLEDAWYPVTAGDFIWMGPWCAQWFGAIGKTAAKYLIYKNWNRHPLAEFPR